MPTNSSKCRQRGLIGSETVVAIALLMVLGMVAADMIQNYRRARDSQLRRQAAAWAAAGQLERYQAGAPINSPPPADVLPEGITFETLVTPGRGQWQGFSQITVIATASLPWGKRLQERISGYVPSEVRP